MKLPLNNQTLFYGAGLISTVASAYGVFSYLMIENNAVGNLLSTGGFMSAAGAMGLGLAIYFGWEVALNHQGNAKRMTAGLIALSAATLSGYTLYQNTAHPIVERERTAQIEQIKRTQQQQDATAVTLKQQQTDLRTQIGDLRQQNATDTASIATLEADGKKGAAWQVVQLRKAIDGRINEIGKLSGRVENYTQRLTAAPTGQSNQQTQPVPPTVISWAMLARASSYEVMTALFLLFGSWYRTERLATANEQIISLTAATHAAERANQDLQNIVITCNRAIAGAKEVIAPAIGTAMDGTQQLSRDAAENLLQTKSIIPASDGTVTLEVIMQATGWG